MFILSFIFVLLKVTEVKKKTGKHNVLSENEMTDQTLSSEPKVSATKFTWESPREFMGYKYIGISLENTKEICT